MFSFSHESNTHHHQYRYDDIRLVNGSADTCSPRMKIDLFSSNSVSDVEIIINRVFMNSGYRCKNTLRLDPRKLEDSFHILSSIPTNNHYHCYMFPFDYVKFDFIE